jgi:signal transduction histidine kinase/ligand-binding sensor domain-containing protein/DNA-binding response OmpR family regulator
MIYLKQLNSDAKLRMAKSILIYIILIFSISYALSQTEYEFQSYKRKNGLSNSSVFAIEQDKEGFLWFGTRDGINRFDGYQFKTFKSSSFVNSDLISNDIRNIVYDSITNSNFIGTLGGLSILNLHNYKFSNFTSTTDTNTLGNNLIKVIHIDKKKRIWVGTGNGIHTYDRENQKFKRYLFDRTKATNIESVLEHSNGQMVIGTTDGLYKLVEENKSIKFLKLEIKNLGNIDINHQNIKTLVEDKNGDIWIGTFASGLFRWSLQKGIVNKYDTNSKPSITNNSVRTLALDNNNQLWVGTFNGLNIFNDGKVSQYLNNEADKNSISDNSIKDIFFDRHNNIWIGTYYGGVNLVTPKTEIFKSYIYNENESKGFNGKVVSSFCEDNEKNIWIGTEGSGLYFLDKNKGLIEKIKNKNFEKLNIKKILLHDNNLYLGLFNNGFSRIDLRTNNVKNNTVGFSPNGQYGGNNVYDILDLDSVLWLNVFGEGIEAYNPTTDKSNNLTSLFKKLGSRNIRTLVKSDNNTIWIGTEKGLNRGTLKRDGSYYVEKFFDEERINSLLEDSDQNLWIGTFDNGLIKYNYLKNVIVKIDENKGLIGKSVFGIQQDNENVWVSTEQGISKINKKNLGVSNYNSSNGLKVTEYNYNASCRTSDGMLLFGGIGGFTMFDPRSIKQSEKISDIIFTDLKQNNIIINPDEKNLILKENINQTKLIELPYSNSSFTIGFSTLDFINNENNHILYKLENFDKSWIRATGRNEVSYTIQKPGTYTFRIKGEDSNGIAAKEKTIEILVKPPFWRSKLAYLIYLLLTALATYSAYKFMKIRHSLQLENMARLKQEELNEVKLRFFTNITHEFRTPLTLINGPVDYLIEKNKDHETINSLNIIQKNTKRLLNLVNQILQFSKMEAGHEKLNLHNVNMVNFLKDIFDVFQGAAKEKNISFTYSYSHPEINLYFDIDKLEKVVYNLLANAFKFSGKNSVIHLSVGTEGQFVVIKVKDNGPGVPKELQEQIFYRFYEKAPHVFFEQKGTGIGLAISKEMVEMHQGTLEVESKENEGATFTIKLPNNLSSVLDKEVAIIHQDNEIIKPKIDIEEFIESIKNDESITSVHTKLDQNIEEWIEDLPLILIVEDNYEVREFLVTILKSQFNILQATNGADALKQCMKHSPDIVVSDVMMPVMDGIALLQSIKSRIEISHIPVILLTAKNEIQEKLLGLSEGADDYLTKPFSPEELSLRIHNLIKIKKIAIEKFSKVINLDPKEITISNTDETFLNSILEHLEKNMDNANYVVDQLAMDMAMSRSVLFTKIKKLTEMTPNNFIKSFKLKRAAALLKTGKLNVSEVCYKVGFKDQKYFRKLFFTEFGVNPSEYQDEKNKIEI